MQIGPWQAVEFTYWPLATLVGAALASYGYYANRNEDIAVRTFVALGSGWFGFAATQMAAFHVGAQASQWFALTWASFIPFVIAGLIKARFGGVAR